MISKIWATGSSSLRGERTMQYNIYILLTDGTRKDFSGTNIDKVNHDAINYLLNLWAPIQNQPIKTYL